MITRNIEIVGYNVIYYDIENKCEGVAYCETSSNKYNEMKMKKLFEEANPLYKALYIEIEKKETHHYVMPIEQFIMLAKVEDD